jgi:hypothetical protein
MPKITFTDDCSDDMMCGKMPNLYEIEMRRENSIVWLKITDMLIQENFEVQADIKDEINT